MGAVKSTWRRLIVKRRWRRETGLLATLAMALLLAACGVSATDLGGASSGTPTTTSASSAPSTTPMSNQPPTSAVALSTDQTTYKMSSPINVTLTNHLSTSIFAYDHQTSCTILTLQRQTASGWENTGGCALGRMTLRVEIKAGATMKITLAPGAGQIRATPWPAGTYVAVLHYFLPGQDMGTAGTAASTPTFTVT